MLGFGTLDGCGGSACVAASPTEIDSSTDPAIVPWHATPFTGAQAIAGAACASSTLCAVLTGAEFVASTDPGDASPAWKTSALPPGFIPDAGQHALACAGGFCLGVGRDGEAAVTTDPGDSSPHWSTARVDGVENLRVACVSRSLCVASDSGGRVLISSDPGASNASWHSSPTGASGLSDIACPSRTLCVAVSSDGHGYVTTDPTDPSPTWTPSTIETPGTNAGSLQSVACLSASLCAASDLFGNVFVSTDPASGAWRATRATTGLGFACTDAGECYSATTPAVVNIADPQASVHFGGAPQTSVGTAIACVGDALCLLGDSRGEITTTADPNDAMPTWSPVQAASSAIRAISCASSTLCVATDAAGEALVSSDPASATATWEPVSLDLGSGANSVSCTRDRLCVVVDDSGREVAAVDPSFAAPNVETGAASDLSSSQATVAGTVDPNNVAVSDCELQWGTTPEFLGTLVGCDSPPGDGNAPVPVTATVSGLDPATTYYYRFVAENEVDRTYGPDRTFRTLASSPSPPPPPPVTCRQGSKWRIRLARGGLRSTTGPDGGVTISVGGQRVLRLTRGRHGDTLSVGRHTVRVTSASSRIMTRHGAHGYTITAGGGRVKVVVVISGDRAVITRYGCSTS
jgi:hypothetical protein